MQFIPRTNTHYKLQRECEKHSFKFMHEFSPRQNERMRSNYDASIKPQSFEVGAYVLLFVPKMPKLPILSGLSFTRGRIKS